MEVERAAGGLAAEVHKRTQLENRYVALGPQS